MRRRVSSRPQSRTAGTALLCLAVALVCQLALGSREAQAQSSESLTARLSRQHLAVGETTTLELVLQGTFRSARRPEIPPLDGLVVMDSSQSSHFSMVNGVIAAQVTFSYQLKAMQAGRYTIPSMSVQVGSRTLSSEPLTVEVAPGQGSTGGATPQAAAPSSRAATAEDAFVQAEITPVSPYVGQQAIYAFRLYRLVDPYDRSLLDLPSFDGFMVYDLAPNRRFVREINGRQYQVTEVRRALFGLSPGEARIDPSILEIPGVRFGETARLETDAVDLSVLALPDGAPDGFSGAVGQFQIESWIDTGAGSVDRVVTVDEPITLVIRISGRGNLEMVSDPLGGAADALGPNWRAYDPKVSTEMQQDGDQITGERVFERPLIARTAGSSVIPPIELHYFDPEAGVYRTSASEGLQIAVEGNASDRVAAVGLGSAKQEIRAASDEIRHIKPAPPSLRAERKGSHLRPAYWAAWAAGPVAVLGVWAADRRRRRRESQSGVERSLRAQRRARGKLRAAQRCLREANQGGCYLAVGQALIEYVADKTDLPPAGLTRDAMASRLRSLGVRQRTIDRLSACLETADSGRFAPLPSDAAIEELLREAESVVQDIEMTLAS